MPLRDDSNPQGSNFQYFWVRDGEIASDLPSNSAPEPQYPNSSMQQSAPQYGQPQYGQPQPSAPQYGQQWAPSSYRAAGETPRRASKTLIWASIAAAGVILVGAVGIALAVRDGDSAGSTTAKSSTIEDWLSATCKKGTYVDGKGGIVLPGAVTSGYCTGMKGTPVYVGSYTFNFLLENDVARFSPRYATAAENSGTTWAFFSVAGVQELAPWARPRTETNSGRSGDRTHTRRVYLLPIYPIAAFVHLSKPQEADK